MSEEAELVELIAHKLRFVEGRPKVLGISEIHPFKYMEHAQWLKIVGQLGNPIHSIEDAPLDLPKEADVLLVQIKDSGMTNSLNLLPDFIALPGWSDTLAVQQQRVFIIDDQVFQASSPVMQIEILAEVIHSKLFAFGHEGTVWTKLSF